jgi:hypothetical protein
MAPRPEYDNPFLISATATATAAKHAMRLALACCRENSGGSVCREFFRAIGGGPLPPLDSFSQESLISRERAKPSHIPSTEETFR